MEFNLKNWKIIATNIPIFNNKNSDSTNDIEDVAETENNNVQIPNDLPLVLSTTLQYNFTNLNVILSKMNLLIFKISSIKSD